MKTNDLSTLGTTYNIVDNNGDSVKHIRIVRHEDILSSALGEFSEVIYMDFDDYLSQTYERVTGFTDDPLKVYWHTCAEYDYQLTDVINVCVANNYDTAIVEIITDDVLDFDMY